MRGKCDNGTSWVQKTKMALAKGVVTWVLGKILFVKGNAEKAVALVETLGGVYYNLTKTLQQVVCPDCGGKGKVNVNDDFDCAECSGSCTSHSMEPAKEFKKVFDAIT